MSLGRDYLVTLGLSPASAAVLGVEIDAAPVRLVIEQRLGIGCSPLWEFAEEIIWFPIHDVSGRTISWTARPFPDKGVPFLVAAGSNNPPFIPCSVYQIAADPSVPIIITSDPIKALVCCSAGMPAVGLDGIWCSGYQVQICKELAKHLKVPPSTLRKVIQDKSEDAAFATLSVCRVSAPGA